MLLDTRELDSQYPGANASPKIEACPLLNDNQTALRERPGLKWIRGNLMVSATGFLAHKYLNSSTTI
jgi:hypothetical protein